MEPCQVPRMMIWFNRDQRKFFTFIAIGAGCLTSGAADSGASSLIPFTPPSSWYVHICNCFFLCIIIHRAILLTLLQCYQWWLFVSPEQVAWQTHIAVCCPLGRFGQSPSTEIIFSSQSCFSKKATDQGVLVDLAIWCKHWLHHKLVLVLLIGVKPVQHKIDFDRLNLSQDLLKGLETDCNLDLVVGVHHSRVGLYAIPLGSCCLDLEAHLVLNVINKDYSVKSSRSWRALENLAQIMLRRLG